MLTVCCVWVSLAAAAAADSSCVHENGTLQTKTENEEIKSLCPVSLPCCLILFTQAFVGGEEERS